MGIQSFYRILWKYKLARFSLQNVPNDIRDAFEIGLKNYHLPRKSNLRDITGNVVDTKTLNQYIELTLPWKFLVNRAETGQCAYKRMAQFSIWLAQYIQDCGYKIIPNVNFNYWNSLPPRLAPRRISWHSRGSASSSLHLKIGSYPGFVSIDRGGYSGWANFSGSTDFLDEDQKLAKARFDYVTNSILNRSASKYDQPASGHIEISEPYIFFPMQIPTDTVAQLSDIDTVSLLIHLSDISCNLSRRIVVKRHPKCRSRRVTQIINKISSTSKIIFTDGNIHSLIKGADAIITVNSGVGAEALLHRKPVFITGKSDYIAATQHISNLKEITQILSQQSLQTFEVDFDKFIAAYTQKYMVEYGDIDALRLHPDLKLFLECGL